MLAFFFDEKKMNKIGVLLIMSIAASLGAMEENENQTLNDSNVLCNALESIQIFYGDKEFKIKKYADQKKLYARCSGAWLVETIGALNEPFEEHLKRAGIN